MAAATLETLTRTTEARPPASTALAVWKTTRIRPLACPRAQPAPTTLLHSSLLPLQHQTVLPLPGSQSLALNLTPPCRLLDIMLPWTPPHRDCSRAHPLELLPHTHSSTLGMLVEVFYLDPPWVPKGEQLPPQWAPLVEASSTRHPLPQFQSQALGPAVCLQQSPPVLQWAAGTYLLLHHRLLSPM